MPQSGPERLRQALLQLVAVARLLGEQPEDRELQHVTHDISNRYIVQVPGRCSSSIGRSHASGAAARSRSGRGWMRSARGLAIAGPRRLLDRRRRASTLSADAERHGLRARPPGGSARLPAGHAHPPRRVRRPPELLRAAQNIGYRHRRPVPGVRRDEPAPRLVRLRREAEAGQRPGDQQHGRARASWARRATSSPATTSRSASTAGGTTCAASHSTAACTRAERQRAGSVSRRRSRTGTASSTRCTTARARRRPSASRRVPRRRARRRPAGRGRARRRGTRSSRRPAVIRASPDGRRYGVRLHRLGAAGGTAARRYADGAAGSRTCPGRWR